VLVILNICIGPSHFARMRPIPFFIVDEYIVELGKSFGRQHISLTELLIILSISSKKELLNIFKLDDWSLYINFGQIYIFRIFNFC